MISYRWVNRLNRPQFSSPCTPTIEAALNTWINVNKICCIGTFLSFWFMHMASLYPGPFVYCPSADGLRLLFSNVTEFLYCRWFVWYLYNYYVSYCACYPEEYQRNSLECANCPLELAQTWANSYFPFSQFISISGTRWNEIVCC